MSTTSTKTNPNQRLTRCIECGDVYFATPIADGGPAPDQHTCRPISRAEHNRIVTEQAERYDKLLARAEQAWAQVEALERPRRALIVDVLRILDGNPDGEVSEVSIKLVERYLDERARGLIEADDEDSGSASPATASH